MARPRFTLRLFEPLTSWRSEPVALDDVDVSPDVSELSWSSELPIGWKSLTAGFYAPHKRLYSGLATYVHDVPFGHVECLYGYDKVFEGRLVEAELDGGGVRGIGVEGYGLSALNDDVILSTDTDVIDSADVARRVLFASAPLLRPASGAFFTPPATRHALSEWDRKYPSEAFDALMKQGADGVLYDMLVYEDRQMRFQPRAEPEQARYSVPFDATIAPPRKDYRGLVSDVLVRFRNTDDGTDAEISDRNLAWSHRVRRRAVLEAGELSAVNARVLARTYLATHAEAALSTTITRDWPRALESLGDVEYPALAARAGEYAEVVGFGKLPVVRTTFDASAGRLTAELGQRVRTTREVVRALRLDRDQRRRRLNAYSGSREST